MAYDPITAGDIVAGKPTKEEIFTKIRSNQEHFDNDIELLKQTSKIDIFDLKYAGEVDQYSEAYLTSLAPTFKAPVTATIVSFVVTLLSPSTSGTLSIKLSKSTDNGINWSPMLTGSVDVTGTTTGSISGTVNFATDGSFSQNDLLRIEIYGIQVDQGNFHISIYGDIA